jgi:hypothetical protein
MNPDPSFSSNVRVVSLPPYCPELNPAEWFGWVVKVPTVNRIYQSLKHLEDHIIAVAQRWSDPAKVATLIHEWMRVEVNTIAKTKSLLAR